jgi:hypothetical protein
LRNHKEGSMSAVSFICPPKAICMSDGSCN